MHAAVYRALPGVESILHFQSLAGTVLASREAPTPDLSFIPELPVYIRKIADVPYLPPGSEALASAAATALGDPDVRLLQLRNHGQLVIGDTPAQAVERATFFELAARMHLLSEGKAELRRYTPDELRLLESY